jgi:surface protein
MNSMFAGCSGLTTIYVSIDWSTANVTESDGMFTDCTSLVGGMGTPYNSNHVDASYARIDGGKHNPGYLSELKEAYAVFNNTTLSFYYDALRNDREGTTYVISEGDDYPEWYDDNTSQMVTQVEFDASFAEARPTTMNGWFAKTRLATLAIPSNLNTEEVTSMSHLFENCTDLTTLDLSRMNTAKVTNMTSMFSGCENLATIYVGSEWNTDAVTESDGMFAGCTSLMGGQGTNCDSGNVDASYAHLDGGGSNPGYLTALSEAYAECSIDNTTLTFYYDGLRTFREGATYSLNTGMDSPEWYIDEVNVSITNVVFDPSFAAARPASTFYWFNEMSMLQSITGMNYLNTENVEYMDNMFAECESLVSLDLSGFNTANVTSMNGMFSNCISLETLDVNAFNTANVTSMSSMFAGCEGLTNLDLTGFNTDKVENMNSLFFGSNHLASVNLRQFNTSNVTDMSYMFHDCDSLNTLDMRSFNTAKVTNMTAMFESCDTLTTIYVGSEWSVNSVTASDNMFLNCNSLVGGQGTIYDENHIDAAYAHIDGGESDPGYLTDMTGAYAVYTSDNTTLTFYYDDQRDTREGMTYDLNEGADYPEWYNDSTSLSITQVEFDESFAAARPTTMFGWFAMTSLESFAVSSNLNTEAVTDMGCMFSGSEALSMLDLTQLNTANVTDMAGMFRGCVSLKTLDLTQLNTANVINMSHMFNGCDSLRRIYVDSVWSVDLVTASDSMFVNCNSLVGGQGTVYDVNHIDATYAHIDGGLDNPGYLSEIPQFQPGDVNGDEIINIADVTDLIDLLLGDSSTAGPEADYNQDGSMNIADVTDLIDNLLSGN